MANVPVPEFHGLVAGEREEVEGAEERPERDADGAVCGGECEAGGPGAVRVVEDESVDEGVGAAEALFGVDFSASEECKRVIFGVGRNFVVVAAFATSFPGCWIVG